MMFHASAKFRGTSKVTASTHLSRGVLSDPIDLAAIRGHAEPTPLSIGMNKSAVLILNTSSKFVWEQEVHWLRAIRLADDCHSCNIQLRRVSSTASPGPSQGSKDLRQEHKLILQVIRPIDMGEELLMWFSEDILILLQMGFLTPANIQGQSNYVCTQCAALYEFPNPLKLHLALDCGRKSLSWFWEQMSQVLLGHYRSITASSEFFFTLTQSRVDPIDLSHPLPTIAKADKDLEESDEEVNFAHKSAFTPFHKHAAATTSTSSEVNYDAILRYHLGHWSSINLASGLQATQANYLRMKQDDESQLETIVSNLGKYKEGHVCMYCGKTYSRKYGLKIHIRTHTGYKPLKCKYCLRPFGDPSNLNKHVRLHTEGDTPYKCELCGKVLVRRRDLERHLKSRHGSPGSPSDKDKTLDDYLSDNANVDDSDETPSISIA